MPVAATAFWRPGDELADQAAGDRRGQQRVPAHDHAQRLQQVGRLGVLQQESARARPQRTEDVLVEPEVGEDHHPHAVQPLVRDDLLGGLDAVDCGHLDVDEHDIRAVLCGKRHRLLAAGGLGDHLDVVFGFEQRPDAAADQRLVVGDEDPYHDRARALYPDGKFGPHLEAAAFPGPGVQSSAERGYPLPHADQAQPGSC